MNYCEMNALKTISHLLMLLHRVINFDTENLLAHIAQSIALLESEISEK